MKNSPPYCAEWCARPTEVPVKGLELTDGVSAYRTRRTGSALPPMPERVDFQRRLTGRNLLTSLAHMPI